ncbi:MAG TPA: glutathione S-transferase N-terminal domain-containing protein [Polyangiaceae bacterium]|nr:glutathione S-transferase N-terminal domain-containing protein [Polyangiaceae bacterium]
MGVRPEKRVVLYEMENCPHSRCVREALSVLDLDADIRPCPQGETHHRQELKTIGGREQIPMLVDPNTMEVAYDAGKIVAYLFRTYGTGKPVWPLRFRPLSQVTSRLASRLRGAAGKEYHAARRPELALELWSYEACPEARLVREVLGEYGMPYVLHNAAHGSAKRDELAKQTGTPQLPHLYDPDRKVRVTGAGNIMAYLRDTYGERPEASYAAEPQRDPGWVTV